MKTDDAQIGTALEKIQVPLLKWYDIHARILPWRENKEPYRVWISEIMLQQTRVEAVKPYFERFLSALPAIQNLAEAPENLLMKLWEGLGYYNRARNLQKAAQIIVEKFNGIFPADFKEILALPGIGEYTAGAIASISFNLPVPAVDGNVLRVVSRLIESTEDILSQQVKTNITEALRKGYPQKRCGDFTQSLMELGATVCLPNGQPKCGECPLANLCLARKNDKISEIPKKTPKKTRRKEEKTILLLCSGDKIAIRQRPKKGLLAGLFEFPNYDGFLNSNQIRNLIAEIDTITPSVDALHIFTHVEWRMKSYIVHCTNPSEKFEWVTRKTLKEEITLPSAFKAFLQEIMSEEPSQQKFEF